MSVLGRIFSKTPAPSALDLEVDQKIKENIEKSERLSERVKKRLSEPPDALDMLIDQDRMEQNLKRGGHAHNLGKDRS